MNNTSGTNVFIGAIGALVGSIFYLLSTCGVTLPDNLNAAVMDVIVALFGLYLLWHGWKQGVYQDPPVKNTTTPPVTEGELK